MPKTLSKSRYDALLEAIIVLEAHRDDIQSAPMKQLNAAALKEFTAIIDGLKAQLHQEMEKAQ